MALWILMSFVVFLGKLANVEIVVSYYYYMLYCWWEAFVGTAFGILARLIVAICEQNAKRRKREHVGFGVFQGRPAHVVNGIASG